MAMLNGDFSRRLPPSPPEVQANQPQDPEPAAPQQSNSAKRIHILLLALFGALLALLDIWIFYPSPGHAAEPIVLAHVSYTLLACGFAQIPYAISYGFSGRLHESWFFWSAFCCLVAAWIGQFTRNVAVFVASGLSLPMVSITWLIIYWLCGHED